MEDSCPDIIWRGFKMDVNTRIKVYGLKMLALVMGFVVLLGPAAKLYSLELLQFFGAVLLAEAVIIFIAFAITVDFRQDKQAMKRMRRERLRDDSLARE